MSSLNQLGRRRLAIAALAHGLEGERLLDRHLPLAASRLLLLGLLLDISPSDLALPLSSSTFLGQRVGAGGTDSKPNQRDLRKPKGQRGVYREGERAEREESVKTKKSSE
ncbi:hypothetical protein NL676_039318 [Syzygium grande]|nr:hypothetical protein NL676_039318 [Syzygium grande]